MDQSVSMRDLEECFGEEIAEAECFGEENPQAEWKPPALKLDDVFEQNCFQLKAKSSIYKTEVNIRIEDEGVQTCLLPLFTKAELESMLKEVQYSLIHFGCFRISLSPLFRLGRNCSAYVALLDNRFLNFEQGKIGSFVCPLHQGPVCVDIFPGYSISLSDAWLSWKLLIAVKGLHRKREASYLSVKVSCMFKLINTDGVLGCGNVKVKTKFGSTQSEGSVIQELRIPEFWDMTGHNPNMDVYKNFSLQEKSLRCWSVRSVFKPVRVLKTKNFTLQLVKPSNSPQVIEPGEHSQTREEQESQRFSEDGQENM
jgi:hypothetical protein